ncbi:MAG: peptidoglycan-associated lipoprotein Pal [Rickettsiales bacterium]|nr:peptidoglycan-associated lipoprotein Pal [Rickettsiales bacterium]
MFKKLLTLAAVFALISCSSKVKTDDSAETTEVKIEDKSTEQNNYQAIADAETAAAMDKKTQVEIQEIEVQDRVLFGYDSAELTDAAKEILNTQVAWLKSDAALNITIEGHCDERGTREYNIALGEKRANAAKSYLTANGVEAARIKVVSFGKERPAFFGTSDDVMAKNRRAVAVVN